jgi:hypothetical protein|nr:MAG TPA: hypothetical protein [Caudoviricetes sp.]
MARTLTEIYTVAKQCRDKYLELTEFQNDSKMSILDAFTWVTSSCIWAFENILDVFKVDLAKDLQNRVNGTPAYFANALLKYQSGDDLVISEDGASFSYATIDESKRIISKVSYSEVVEDGYHDKLAIYKIATGEPGAYARIEEDELLAIRAYLGKILFAGQHAMVVSRNGDVLIPRVTVYHDGAISEDELYTNIENSLNDFIANMSFDGMLYAQKIIDCIQNAEHVTDVEVDRTGTDQQGIFIAMYDDDNNLIEVEDSVEQRIGRYVIPNSGYIKQSTRSGKEENLQTWREAITLKLEDKQ